LKSKNPTKYADLSFEEAFKRLEGILRELEKGQSSLEDSLHFYQEGVEYLYHCQYLLESAEQKIEVIQKKAQGSLQIQEISEISEAKDFLEK
jgi:exodeoxyribonuclease VII small subunit